MVDYDKLYDRFELTPQRSEELRRLTEPPLYTCRRSGRVLVETILVEGGERRVIKKEEQGAQLV